VRRILSFLATLKHLLVVLTAACFFLAILVRFFLPELAVSFYGLLVVGLVLLALYVLGAYRDIGAFLVSKQGRYGVNTGVMILVFVGIMVLANYLGATGHRRFDVTASSQFTLAPQTVNVLQGLKEEVTAIGFFPDDPQYNAAQQVVRYLLEEYRFHNRKFKFKFVDPEAEPAAARQYRVLQSATIVFVSGERQKAVREATEQAFTGAILEVTGVEAKKVYFLAGHGERDPENPGQEGYSLARQGLIRDLYKVEGLTLTATPQVPEDCAVLVIAGPKNAFPEPEKTAVDAYLKRNGKVLLLVDPSPPKQVNEMLSEWGLEVEPGRIMDAGAYAAPDRGTPAVFRGSYPPLVVTSGLDTTYFPEAASIVLTPALQRVAQQAKKADQQEAGWPLTAVQQGNLAILPVALTTENSWVEKGSQADRQEKRGRKALAAMLVATVPLAAEEPQGASKDKLTRIVVIGDSDFAANGHFRNGGNGDLFVNSVNWLAEEEHLISIRPKQYSFRRLLVGQNAARFIRYASVGLLPLLVLMAGGVIWWRQR